MPALPIFAWVEGVVGQLQAGENMGAEDLNLKPVEIMATVGPTLEKEDDLRKAAESGARWFRLPFGYRHRDHRAHARIVAALREKFDPPLCLLLDLPSSRPRTGAISDLPPSIGQVVVLYDPEVPGDPLKGDELLRVPLPGMKALLGKLAPGQRILFLDGRVELKVEAVSAASVSARWQRGELPLKAGNSVFLPDSRSPFIMVTPEDTVILRGLADDGSVPDWVALSLVSSAEDVATGRQAVQSVFGKPVRIMAKIETREGVEEHKTILKAADGLMVARGDLGQAIPFEELPHVQDELVAAARGLGKPAVVATQFLEVFAETGVPQRSELSDLALAARQRATAIMLGKETVYSKRPIESIRMAASVLAAEGRHLKDYPHSTFLAGCQVAHEGGTTTVIAVEGPNGGGKTTLCHLLCDRHGYDYCRGVPAAWEEPQLKLRMIRDADWLASALYFLSGAIEVSREITGHTARIVVMDRSVWSTLAVHYAFDPARLHELLPIVESAKAHLPIPSMTIVLEASPFTCRARIGQKARQEQVFDDAAPADEGFLRRERDFYRWLSRQGPRIAFINTEGRDSEAVYRAAAAAMREARLC
jgi:pyruvate kinase